MMTLNKDFKHLGKGLKIDYYTCDNLKPYKNNPRTHSAKQIRQIANSIKEFGFTNPILIDGSQNIIAGHGRVDAARLLGLKTVPTINLSYLSDVQKRAYIIADNKLAENAGWDFELLQSEILTISEMDLNFDLTLTGFEVSEIDKFLSPDEVDEMYNQIPESPVVPVSKLGDVWHLGDHTIFCGDATDKQSYDRLIDFDVAQAVFTDPPYNVKINGHVCGNGKTQHDEFKMASGEMSEAEFTHFLQSVLCNLKLFSADGSLHYICMDWRHMKELITAGSVYTELKNLCIWNKSNGGMGSLYRSKHELVFVYKNGRAAHVNNIELGKHGRYRTNVWDYAGVNTFQNNKDLELHPTVKPIAMIEDAILDCTKRGDIVLDVFGGSGSTLIAAEKCGRKARLMELDPKYVDVTIRRYQDVTGRIAIHENGQTFEEVREVCRV